MYGFQITALQRWAGVRKSHHVTYERTLTPFCKSSNDPTFQKPNIFSPTKKNIIKKQRGKKRERDSKRWYTEYQRPTRTVWPLLPLFAASYIIFLLTPIASEPISGRHPRPIKTTTCKQQRDVLMKKNEGLMRNGNGCELSRRAAAVLKRSELLLAFSLLFSSFPQQQKKC